MSTSADRKTRNTDDYYAPWRAWVNSEVNPQDVTLDVRELTDGYHRDLAHICPQVFRSQVLGHCMRTYGFLVISGMEFDSRQVQRDLLAVCRQGFEILPQEIDKKPIMALTPSNSEFGWLPRQPLHTDAGHFLGLLCVVPARSGGDSLLTSALWLHETLRREAPDLEEVCRRPWAFHRNDRPGPAYYEWPIFRDDADFGLSCYYLPNTIRGTPTRSGTLLTEEQRAALSKIDEICSRPEATLRWRLGKGQMLIVNNKKILHARDAFYRAPKDQSRLLLRVWLNRNRSELSRNAPAY